jgi:hypothetical protein
MFFIGSTGPILTLIITILLPFFLLTAKKPVNTDGLASRLTVIQQITITSNGTVVVEKATSWAKNLLTDKFLFLKWQIKTLQPKFPNYPFQFKKLLFILNDSGNKAPPVFC